MNGVLGINGVRGINGIGNNLKTSTPWIAYDRTNNIINLPVGPVSANSNGHTSSKDNFGASSHTGAGDRAYVQTRMADGSSTFIPTQGCSKVTFRMFIGSTSYYAQSAMNYLYGKKKDGTEELIASKFSNVGSTPNTSSTWAATINVEDYVSVRLYGNMTWGDSANSWVSAYINYVEFHD